MAKTNALTSFYFLKLCVCACFLFREYGNSDLFLIGEQRRRASESDQEGRAHVIHDGALLVK